MKCYFCRKETVKVIRCEDCKGAVALPTVLFKGSGFTNNTLIGSVQVKNETDPDTGEKVYRK